MRNYIVKRYYKGFTNRELHDPELFMEYVSYHKRLNVKVKDAIDLAVSLVSIVPNDDSIIDRAFEAFVSNLPTRELHKMLEMFTDYENPEAIDG